MNKTLEDYREDYIFKFGNLPTVYDLLKYISQYTNEYDKELLRITNEKSN